jgi:hypothetical protein
MLEIYNKRINPTSTLTCESWTRFFLFHSSGGPFVQQSQMCRQCAQLGTALITYKMVLMCIFFWLFYSFLVTHGLKTNTQVKQNENQRKYTITYCSPCHISTSVSVRTDRQTVKAKSICLRRHKYQYII